MKIGMNLLLWTASANYLQHEKLIRKIKQIGFDGVEFTIDPINDYDLKRIAMLLSDLEMGATAITSFDKDFADPSSSDVNMRKAALEHLKMCIDKTKLLGSEILVGPLFGALGHFPGKGPTESELQWSAEVNRAAAEYAKKLGIRIAMEPINRFELYLCNTVEDGLNFLDRMQMDNVGLLLDTHHSNIEEYDVIEAWNKAGHKNKIFHVHISENNRGIPGRGHAIPSAIFDTLKKVDYDQWVTIEGFGIKVKEIIDRLYLWRQVDEVDEDVAVLGYKYIREQLDRL